MILLDTDVYISCIAPNCKDIFLKKLNYVTYTSILLVIYGITTARQIIPSSANQVSRFR
jgi:hypothetical protein